MRFTFYLMLLFFLAMCKHEEEFKPVYDVPEEYQALITSFIYEASIRGHSVVINNLIILYDEKVESPDCGKCNSTSLNPNVQKVISINPNIQCGYDPVEEENFLFHELGHCILGRAHTNEKLPNGDPKSIMTEGSLSLYAPCIYQIDEEICDKTFKRAYYLDELFDANTAVPAWGH